MAAPGGPPHAPDPYLIMLRVGAIASAIMSGTFALLAFIFGSPLEFGIALALCAVWWTVDDFVTSMLKREQIRVSRACPSGYAARLQMRSQIAG